MVIYSLNKIMKVFSIVRTFSTHLYELDLTSNPFSDTTIIIYEIELPPYGNKIGLNLLDDEYFTIPYVIDTIPISPVGHQLLTSTKKILWIVAINIK